MQFDLRPLIDDIASRADDFLADASDRAQARAGIEELLTIEHNYLNPADRKLVVGGVMAVLEDEDFFGTQYASGAFDEEEDDEE